MQTSLGPSLRGAGLCFRGWGLLKGAELTQVSKADGMRWNESSGKGGTNPCPRDPTGHPVSWTCGSAGSSGAASCAAGCPGGWMQDRKGVPSGHRAQAQGPQVPGPCGTLTRSPYLAFLSSICCRVRKTLMHSFSSDSMRSLVCWISLCRPRELRLAPCHHCPPRSLDPASPPGFPLTWTGSRHSHSAGRLHCPPGRAAQASAGHLPTPTAQPAPAALAAPPGL